MKRTRIPLGAALVLGALLFGGCGPVSSAATSPAPSPTPVGQSAGGAQIANPASVFCRDHGYRLEIRAAPDGSQSGVCVFPDGSECDEWAFYRGGCGAGKR